MAMRRLVGSRGSPSLVNGVRMLCSSHILTPRAALEQLRLNKKELLRKYLEDDIYPGSFSRERIDNNPELLRKYLEDDELNNYGGLPPTPQEYSCTLYRKSYESATGVEANNPNLWFGQGCDFDHWKVYTKPLPGSPPKDLIIRYYIQTLAQLFGSEEEAVKKMYSVATRHYYAFGALFSDELADKLKFLPNVCYVIPDAYVDTKGKRYPWDPFVKGQALPVPYDRKYYPNAPTVSLTDEELGKTTCRQYFPTDRYTKLNRGLDVQMTGVPNKDVVPELAR